MAQLLNIFVDGEWTTTEPVAVEGENTIIIRQTDDAGNSSESSTLTFTLDTTAPDARRFRSTLTAAAWRMTS
ncbi:Ig-like domain-containing protein [Vibrio vulnificus]|uniref:Ig-like domain-containing protein n=1 Tax=Vibrio vulnificus TaxID=672 RepID=UPI000E0FB61C|nr:Ig-like domain-containing protein [Vibrio vulnificus]